jgi:hypothetical protein
VDIDGGCLWDSNVLNTTLADVSLESGLRLGALGGFRLGRILDVGRFWTWEDFGRGKILDVGRFWTWEDFGRGKIWTWEESKVGEILGVRHGEIWTSGILDFGLECWDVVSGANWRYT